MFKRNLAIYLVFLEFAYILWEATKATIVLTDNKSVTRFLLTKAIPPALWIACDYLLQNRLKSALFASSVNTAADILSTLELKVTEKIRLIFREIIQTILIEVTTSSSDVADEEQFFFTQADNENESEEQTNKPLNKKNKRRWNGLQMRNHPPGTNCEKITKSDEKTTSYSMNEIKANARTLVEQEMPKTIQMGIFKLHSKLLTRSATCSLRNCLCRTGTNYNSRTSTNSRGCLAATPGDIYRSI